MASWQAELSLLTPLLSVVKETLSDRQEISCHALGPPPLADLGPGALQGLGTALGKVGSVLGEEEEEELFLLCQGCQPWCCQGEQGTALLCTLSLSSQAAPCPGDPVQTLPGGVYFPFFHTPTGSVLVWSPWCVPCCVSSVSLQAEPSQLQSLNSCPAQGVWPEQ